MKKKHSLLHVKKEEEQGNGFLPQQMKADNPGYMPKIKSKKI